MNRRNSYNVHNEEIEQGKSIGLLLLGAISIIISVSIMLPHLHR